MKNGIVITIDESLLLIAQSKRRLFNNRLSFFLNTFIIFGIFYFLYYFIPHQIKPLYFILFSLLYWLVIIFLNAFSFRLQSFSIQRKTEHQYLINNKESEKQTDKKEIILLEFAGEDYGAVFGNVILRISNRDYMVLKSATQSEVEHIISGFNKYFNENLPVRTEKLY